MRFTSFHIKNYKGVQDCRLDLELPDPRVVALVGLNESGKTTLLEAISHFVAGDRGLQRIYSIETTSVDKSSFVPKSKQLNFNDKISIAATLELDQEDVAAVEQAFNKLGYTIAERRSSYTLTVVQQFAYENSNYVDGNRTWSLSFKVRKIKGTKVSVVNSKHECWNAYWSTTENRLPQICYFPTFLFDVPDKILIEDHTDESATNAYYRRLIQDVLDSLNQGLSLQTHVIDRIRGKSGTRTWQDFVGSDERAQVKHVLDSASSKITWVIIQSWKRVFKGDFDNKRIEIDFEQDNETGLVALRLNLSDFPERYDVKERSLGFQWFFCFWLFTYFRTLRANQQGVVFLLDEPASNLHAGAQEEVLKSLSGLAIDNNLVIYSTHSHYLINPAWLDRTLIVSNGTGADGIVGHEFEDRKAISIDATPYRKFAFKHKNQRTYFLPILDALDYRPSELTISRKSLIVEGKSDFCFLSLYLPSKKSYNLVPASGAMSMSPLLSLLDGWGFPSACLLDDDKEGIEALKKYIKTDAVTTKNAITLASLEASFSGLSLESILLDELSSLLQSHFETQTVNKSHLLAYLQENLASGVKPDISAKLKSFIDRLDEWCTKVFH